MDKIYAIIYTKIYITEIYAIIYNGILKSMHMPCNF